jgi:hypothetical protein
MMKITELEQALAQEQQHVRFYKSHWNISFFVFA